MPRQTAYRVLAGTLGIAFLLFGLALTFGFFRYQAPGSTPAIPTGPVGFYFVAFTGCALVAWGGGLLGIARQPLSNRALATSTAAALVLMAIVRMTAWLIGDYYEWLGDLPRAEAGFFLLLALAFVWLRPTAGEIAPS
jgi:hypothetical protein